MKKTLLIVLLAIMVIGAFSCSQPVAGQVVQSDKPRDTSPEVSPSDRQTLVNGNTAFAFDLYRILRQSDLNLFYSPYSISEALAMTYAGARGETEAQMAATLHFLLAQEKLHPAINNLDLILKQRGEGAKGKDDEGFRLNIVNAIWGQRDYKFLSTFLDVLAENYGAGLRLLDFINKPEDSRLIINDWVAEQTEDRIKDLIPQGAIDPLTRLVLTNAIYFNAAWQYPFAAEATTSGTFYTWNGNTTTAQMMYQSHSFGYAAGNGYRAVELPYSGGELSMAIILPDAGLFSDFEASLNAAKVAEIIGNLEPVMVNLSMPKFEFESSFGLNDTLKEMGMTDAFDPAKADFSGMNGKGELYITDVIHKAFVSVDEAGTEAAAATAVIVGLTSAPAEIVDLTIDHPFIFFIRDIETGAVLFIGRVLTTNK